MNIYLYLFLLLAGMASVWGFYELLNYINHVNPGNYRRASPHRLYPSRVRTTKRRNHPR